MYVYKYLGFVFGVIVGILCKFFSENENLRFEENSFSLKENFSGGFPLKCVMQVFCFLSTEKILHISASDQRQLITQS